jgi:nitrite reductase (NADH) large subunit
VQRYGIEKLRAIVVDDREGIAERLDAEMAASKASYKDPWKEAWMQPTPNQFASELRVIS